jgi:hypothetical protein
MASDRLRSVTRPCARARPGSSAIPTPTTNISVRGIGTPPWNASRPSKPAGKDTVQFAEAASQVAPEVIFVIVLLVAIFAADLGRRWWRENEWKRRWRRGKDED